MTDYTTFTDAQIEEERLALMGELERRRNLERIPEDIKEMMAQYRAAGGDPAVLASELEESSG